MSVVCVATCLLVGGLALSQANPPGAGVTFRDMAYQPCARVTQSVGDAPPVGTVIELGETISTGKGRAVLTLSNNTTLYTGENTELKCDQFLTSPGEPPTTVWSVLQGLFMYVSGLIGHKPDPMLINTSACGGGIRGSVLVGAVLPGGKLLLHVIEGSGFLRFHHKPNFNYPAGEGLLINGQSYQETPRLPPGVVSFIPARYRPPSITALKATGRPHHKPVLRFKLSKTAKLKIYVRHRKHTLLTMTSRGKAATDKVTLSRPLPKGSYTVELVAAHHGLTSIATAPLHIR